MMDWLPSGKCQTEGPMDPNFFYPSNEDRNKDDAKNLETLEANRAQFCHGVVDRAPCPVRLMCLQYALDNHERGVWGGTTENERRRIRKRQRRTA